MEENKNMTSAAAAEETIASIKKLMEAVGNDEELKLKLEDTLAALTGKTKKSETAASAEDSSDAAPEEEESNDEEEDISCNSSAGTDFSDVFTEDAIAGMVVGFVAGAAVVGGGVLLHKLLK